MGSKSPPKTKQREPVRAIRVSSRDFPSVPGSAYFSAGAIRGSGTILDLSSTGAHIYRPSKNVPQGVRVDLYFLQPKTERRLHAEAEVVRKTEFGFAVRFLRLERELEALVLAATGEAKRDPST